MLNAINCVTSPSSWYILTDIHVQYVTRMYVYNTCTHTNVSNYSMEISTYSKGSI